MGEPDFGDWQSLRFVGRYAGGGLDGQDLAGWRLPEGRRHLWKVHRRRLDGAPAAHHEGIVAVVEGERAWHGPYLPEWPLVGATPDPGWGEPLRAVVEAVFDRTGWSGDEVWRLTRMLPGADAAVGEEALARLGMKLVGRQGGDDTWALDPRVPEQVFDTPDAGSRRLGIALSGGGLRAAGFALGGLTVLDDLGLTPAVRTVTAVSGGALLLALRLAAQALDEVDFRASALRWLAEDLDDPGAEGARPDTLVRRYADLFDRVALRTVGGRAGLTLGDVAVPFEAIFQVTEMSTAGSWVWGVHAMDRVHPRGPVWGAPGRVVLPDATVVRKIRLADAAVASAAFPVGFEPFVFPRDVVLPAASDDEAAPADIVRAKLAEAVAKGFWPRRIGPKGQGGRVTDVPLVDGGVVDNQGITELIKAVHRSGNDLFDLLVIDADATDERDDLLGVAPPRPTRSHHALGWGTVGAVITGATVWPFAGAVSALAAMGALIGGALGVRRARGVLPGGLGLGSMLWPPRLARALAVRAKLAMALLLDAFMRRVRRLTYGALYTEGLPRHVSVSQAGIRDVSEAGPPPLDADRPSRTARLLAAYPVGTRTRALASEAAQLGTGLRFGRTGQDRWRGALASVHTGRVTVVRAWLELLAAVPRPRTPAARRWEQDLAAMWRAEGGPDGVPAPWIRP